VLSLAVLSTVGPALAKKPPKPPPEPPPGADTGTIYFMQYVRLYEMETDGTQKTLIFDDQPAIGGQGYGSPSRALHGSERWFLTFIPVSGATYPSGRERRDLSAISESGSVVTLCDDPDLEVNSITVSGNSVEEGCPRWTEDGSTVDGKVSFLAKRWGVDPDTGEDVVAEWGIFAATLDPSDLPGATSLDLTWSRVPLSLALKNPDWDTNGDGIPDGGWIDCEYDWAPGGTAIVYDDASGIWRANEGSPAWTKTLLTTYGSHPRWSPAGDRIVFRGDGPIQTMDTNGDNVVTVVEDPPDTPTVMWTVWWPCWSPSGTHLVYFLGGWNKKKYYGYPGDIYRCTSSGADTVNLTEDFDKSATPIGWAAQR
jgi:hypothetical protein